VLSRRNLRTAGSRTDLPNFLPSFPSRTWRVLRSPETIDRIPGFASAFAFCAPSTVDAQQKYRVSLSEGLQPSSRPHVVSATQVIFLERPATEPPNSRPATTSACICRGATNCAASLSLNRVPTHHSNRLGAHPAQSTAPSKPSIVGTRPSRAQGLQIL